MGSDRQATRAWTDQFLLSQALFSTGVFQFLRVLISGRDKVGVQDKKIDVRSGYQWVLFWFHDIVIKFSCSLRMFLYGR